MTPRFRPGSMGAAGRPTLAQRLILGLILGYRYSFSFFLGRQCRFLPTCSEYAAEAVRRHGAWAGGRLALKRVARCHPWGGSGYDPVPPSAGEAAGVPSRDGAD